jgi:TRAP-type mannitol/chloroaromatic compound transport system permease small subunit
VADRKASRGAGRPVQSGIERLVDLVGEATSWIALAIVGLMTCNVLLRYFFRTGSVWAQELEWHLLAPLIRFGMSYALRSGAHVRVDILYAKFPEHAKALVDLLSALLTIAISLLVIWYAIGYVGQSFSILEQSPDPGGLPYRFLLKSLIPIGFALLLRQSVASAIAALGRLGALK